MLCIYLFIVIYSWLLWSSLFLIFLKVLVADYNINFVIKYCPAGTSYYALSLLAPIMIHMHLKIYIRLIPGSHIFNLTLSLFSSEIFSISWFLVYLSVILIFDFYFDRRSLYDWVYVYYILNEQWMHRFWSNCFLIIKLFASFLLWVS